MDDLVRDIGPDLAAATRSPAVAERVVLREPPVVDGDGLERPDQPVKVPGKRRCRLGLGVAELRQLLQHRLHAAALDQHNAGAAAFHFHEAVDDARLAGPFDRPDQEVMGAGDGAFGLLALGGKVREAIQIDLTLAAR